VVESLLLEGSKQIFLEPLSLNPPLCREICLYGPFLPLRGEEGVSLGKADKFLRVIVSFPFQEMASSLSPSFQSDPWLTSILRRAPLDSGSTQENSTMETALFLFLPSINLPQKTRIFKILLVRE
jgi:hypothetical protein